ncbi:MAG: hypothetical protein WBZ20_12470 [Nitrososphaeraceae archaeon]
MSATHAPKNVKNIPTWNIANCVPKYVEDVLKNVVKWLAKASDKYVHKFGYSSQYVYPSLFVSMRLAKDMPNQQQILIIDKK